MKPLFAMEPLYHFPRAPAALKVHSIWKKGKVGSLVEERSLTMLHSTPSANDIMSNTTSYWQYLKATSTMKKKWLLRVDLKGFTSKILKL